MSEGKEKQAIAIQDIDIETLTQDVIQAAWLATSDDDVRNVLVNFFCDLLNITPDAFERD